MLQRIFRLPNLSAHRITRAISIAVLMVLVCLVSQVKQQIIEESSWFVGESGTSQKTCWP